MKKNQNIVLASRLRQYSELRGASVVTETALAAAAADNPIASKVLNNQTTPQSIADFLPTSMPHTRALLSTLTTGDEGTKSLVVRAAADVLDDPGSGSAGWSILYVSLVGAGLVVILFSVFVAPTFQHLFESFGTQLPAPTVIALFVAQWFVGPLGGLLVLLLLAKGIWTFRPELLGKFTQNIDSVLLNAPLVGQASRVTLTKRLAAWLAATGTGDGLNHRLDCLVELAGRGQFGRQVSRLATAVQSGQSLHAALAVPGWLPGLALLLKDAADSNHAQVGDPAAQLDAYSRALDARADAVTARLMLIAQLIVGAVVGFFVIAMYLPIFKMGSVI